VLPPVVDMGASVEFELEAGGFPNLQIIGITTAAPKSNKSNNTMIATLQKWFLKQTKHNSLCKSAEPY